LPNENPVPAYRNPWNIALVIAIVVIIILAAFVLTQTSGDGGGHPGPTTFNVQIDVLSAKWEQLSLADTPPTYGMQYLWIKLKLTNGLEDQLPIVPVAFSAEGNDGLKFNATDDDSSGALNPGANETFDLSFEVPTSWYPKKAFFTILKQSTSDTIPSPALLVPDVVLSNSTWFKNSTDSNNQTYAGQQVLHLTFDFANQWKEDIVTDMTYFSVKDSGGVSKVAAIMTGQTTVQQNATDHFTLEFVVPNGYIPKTLYFQSISQGPYASKTL